MMRGTSWLLPLELLPPLLHNISNWSQANPKPVTSPIFIQTLVNSDYNDISEIKIRSRTSSVGSSVGQRSQYYPLGSHGQGYLSPKLDSSSSSHSSFVTVWYDWFLPEVSPDPLLVNQLERFFHQVILVYCTTC